MGRDLNSTSALDTQISQHKVWKFVFLTSTPDNPYKYQQLSAIRLKSQGLN